MKAYGYSRRDALTCKYGCCGYCLVTTHNEPRSRKAYDRARRKRARRLGKKEAAE